MKRDDILTLQQVLLQPDVLFSTVPAVSHKATVSFLVFPLSQHKRKGCASLLQTNQICPAEGSKSPYRSVQKRQQAGTAQQKHRKGSTHPAKGFPTRRASPRSSEQGTGKHCFLQRIYSTEQYNFCFSREHPTQNSLVFMQCGGRRAEQRGFCLNPSIFVPFRSLSVHKASSQQRRKGLGFQ